MLSRTLVIPLLLGGAILHCPGAAPTHAAPAEARPTVEKLLLAVQRALSRDLGRDDAVYHLTAFAGGGTMATNPRTGLEAILTPSSMQVRAGADTWSLSLAGWGRGADPSVNLGRALHPPPAAGWGVVQANRLEVARGALAEWYVNGPLGLQQGWTLGEPPPGVADAPLTLTFTQGGSLRGRAESDRRGLALAGRTAAQWRYTNLLAYDDTGRALPAWLSVDGERVLVQVDDAGATYPLVVNTWVQAAKLIASDGTDADQIGWSVAVSADGNTVVAGAPSNDVGGSDRGAAYVYTRPETGWSPTATFSAKLIASDGADHDWLGWSVAVSADGSTVVAGAPGNAAGGSQRGAVCVYTRPETGWPTTTEPTAKLTTSDGADNDWLGHAVAVSADGNTVVAGAPRNDAGGVNRGAAYVYARPEAGWSSTATFSTKLIASDGADHDWLGWSVAVSADGETVVASAPSNDAGGSDRGAAYVYIRPETGWKTAATFIARLTASDGADLDWLGHAVAVSADGRTLVAGAPRNAAGGSQRGAVYVFNRPETGWATTATFGARLTTSSGADLDELGTSVAVSADGNTVVASAIYNAAGGSQRGAVYVYVRPEAGWTTSAAFAAKLVASDGADVDWLGCEAAVSADGNTAVGGAPQNDDGGAERGAVYVWAILNTPPTPAFTVTPTSGDTSTVFQFDASACTDVESPPSLLEVRWDWEDDGTYDTALNPTKTASHTYGSPGTYTIRLQVLDGGGLTNSTTQQVTVTKEAGAHRVFLPLVLSGSP